MKELSLLIGLLVLVLVGVMLIKTILNRPPRAAAAPPGIENFDEAPLAEHLAGAVRFRTVSTRDTTGAGIKEFLALHRYLDETFPLVHSTLTCEEIGAAGRLYCWQGKNPSLPPILLLAHFDVVPVADEQLDRWEHKPFSGDIAQGFIWGRGTMDDKQAMVGIMDAVEMLIGERFQPERTVYLAFGHDEEIGGKEGAVRIAALLRERNIRPEYILDEGLLITEGVISHLARPVALIGIAEKGYVSCELTVRGTPGHSSMPPPHTAVGVLAQAVVKLEDNQFPVQLTKPQRTMLEGIAPAMPFGMRLVLSNLWLTKGVVERILAASPKTNAAIRTTTAVTMIEGGIKENVLPSKAKAVVNFRILPGESVASVLKHVRETIADPTVNVSFAPGWQSEPSAVSDIDARSFRILKDTVERLFPDVIVTPGLVIATTDSRHYEGLSNNIYRFSPIRARAEDLERVHGENERISVHNYAEIVRFYRELIRNTAH
ncbi:MAG: M20 family peptidase [Smithellaceae bacterium]|nr:M20 family peptidase [Smithellaceae bacterium]